MEHNAKQEATKLSSFEFLFVFEFFLLDDRNWFFLVRRVHDV